MLGTLTVFAIRAGGAEPDELWDATLQQAEALELNTARRTFKFSRHEDVNTDDRALPDDIGLHMDIMPTQPSLVRSIRIHQLLQGGYSARFFEIAPEYTEPTKAHYNPDHLPEGTYANYCAGQVDPGVLMPECREMTAQAGDIAVFRMSGQRPLAHDFRTTALPRLFRIITLDLP